MSQVRASNYADAAGGNTAQVNGRSFITSTNTIAANRNNSTIPTSQAVADYADAAAAASSPFTLLGTINTTSGTTASLSSLTLTPYKFLRFVANGVSGTASFNLTLDGVLASQASGSAAAALVGFIELDLQTGVFSSTLGTSGNNFSVYSGATSYRTSTTSIVVGCGGGNFDLGSITVYGVR